MEIDIKKLKVKKNLSLKNKYEQVCMYYYFMSKSKDKPFYKWVNEKSDEFNKIIQTKINELKKEQ